MLVLVLILVGIDVNKLDAENSFRWIRGDDGVGVSCKEMGSTVV